MPVWHPKERHQCADCGCWEGQLHTEGCTLEACPAADCPWPRHQCPVSEHHTLPRAVMMLYPVLCARCGSPFPPMFHVAEALWRVVVGEKCRGITLCRSCFQWMRRVIYQAVPSREDG
jgi:hypothetical protein